MSLRIKTKYENMKLISVFQIIIAASIIGIIVINVSRNQISDAAPTTNNLVNRTTQTSIKESKSEPSYVKANIHILKDETMEDAQISAKGGDIEKAIRIWKEFANQGNSDAQWRLGSCYISGNGVDQDDKKAIELYKKSATQGNGDAQAALGACYIDGVGVSKDTEKGMEFLKKSVLKGNKTGLYLLGQMYESLSSIKNMPELKDKSIELYKMSAKKGFELAQKKLLEKGEIW
jgi:TPR repeat protein